MPLMGTPTDAAARGVATLAHVSDDPGAENELRLMRRLWNDAEALGAVRHLGLADATIRRFRLGLNEPYLPRGSDRPVERALAFPVYRADGSRCARWGYLNLDGITCNPQGAVVWGAGAARTYFSRPVTIGSSLLLVPTPLDVWLISQLFGSAHGDLVVACPSHFEGTPGEWRDRAFWGGWSDVVLGLSEETALGEIGVEIARRADRELRRLSPPGGGSWSEFVLMGGSGAELRTALERAERWSAPTTLATVGSRSISGDFAADPIAIEGALINGRLHYPITLERRELEERGGGGAAMVQRYVTRVLRSDGIILDVERLAAPRGTPLRNTVVALTDGTRIISAPQPSGFDTWRYPSIERFIDARSRGDRPEHRALPRLLADVEAHLRSNVWLPHAADFALAALFVVATFVHRAFSVFPILLLNGPRGTGKSELGQAMASVCCNGLVAGKISPAGLVRVLAQSRGTVVLDDLEAIGGRGSGGEELVQILKVSYKASTARRIAPGRDGHVEVLDFFAPKIVTNISGVDPILLSRMLTVRTGAMPVDADLLELAPDAAALRDELHVWAMCSVADVAEAYAPIAAQARSRRAEIAAPLMAVAVASGEGSWIERLEEALAAEPDAVSEAPEVILARALEALVRNEGVVSVAMPRLLLEMALSIRDLSTLPSAEALGRMLLVQGARDPDGPVERRRLHGEVTRIYRLSPQYLQMAPPASSAPDPFSFCEGRCQSCRYVDVCEEAVPWLRPAATRRR